MRLTRPQIAHDAYFTCQALTTVGWTQYKSHRLGRLSARRLTAPSMAGSPSQTLRRSWLDTARSRYALAAPSSANGTEQAGIKFSRHGLIKPTQSILQSVARARLAKPRAVASGMVRY